METIYNRLLNEAKQSPMLLSDLAGLETYISESYTDRSFIELLQNADDAGATHFLVEKYGNYLIVANNGRIFSASDVESLCRSASSSKVRGSSIGYRGIGFKSVVSIAKEVHIISGDYEITFSKEITRSIIPEATKVPLIRIPHFIRSSVKNELCNTIDHLKVNNYTTFFIFSGVPIEQIKNEYEGFLHTSLLFLNNIREINVKIENPIITYVDTIYDSGEYKQKVVIDSNKKTEWRIYSKNDCSVVFPIVDGKISKLKLEDARIHAFLPTDDNTGLGILVNADFSTDPSRRHLIFDDNTIDAIKKICCLYYSLFKKHIVKNDDESKLIIDALLPYFDIRLVHFTNNAYYKQFSICIKELSKSLSSIKLPPSWLNISDYSKMTETINCDCFNIVGFEAFLKFFDCKTESITEILNKVEDSNISIVGCAEIASYCIKQSLMNADVTHFTRCNLFSSDNKCYSLQYINDNGLKIDLHYIRMLQDKGVDEKDLKIYFKKFSFNNILKVQFLNEDVSNEPILKFVKNDSKSDKDDSNKQQESHGRIVSLDSNVTSAEIKSKTQSVVRSNTVWMGSNSDIVNKESVATPKKWRSAETNALNILNANGFKLRDVSNNNVGYDLEGLTPEGDDIFIEVKSIDYKGQSFRVTNNEFAVAQQKQDSYYILLFLQKQEYVELGWIRNPIKNLIMNRQCVQWVWVCDEYNYEPLKVDL